MGLRSTGITSRIVGQGPLKHEDIWLMPQLNVLSSLDLQRWNDCKKSIKSLMILLVSENVFWFSFRFRNIWPVSKRMFVQMAPRKNNTVLSPSSNSEQLCWRFGDVLCCNVQCLSFHFWNNTFILSYHYTVFQSLNRRNIGHPYSAIVNCFLSDNLVALGSRILFGAFFSGTATWGQPLGFGLFQYHPF